MSTEGLQWHLAVPGKLMNVNEVHVWNVFLDITSVELEFLLGFLSVDELARAERFHFENDKRRFIAARGILRKLLGHYLGKKPGDIRFEYTSYGKPALAPGLGKEQLSFNLSHSGSYALCAVTQQKNIGIDIERIRDDIEIEQIARKFFSQKEISELEKIDLHKRSELFFQYWTRKEAFLKAAGKGISFPMDQCDISLISGSVLSPVTVEYDNSTISGLYVQDLFPGTGYAAAIAIEGDEWNISCLNYLPYCRV